MKKVYQTKFGVGYDVSVGECGNCHAACVASVFEIGSKEGKP